MRRLFGSVLLLPLAVFLIPGTVLALPSQADVVSSGGDRVVLSAEFSAPEISEVNLDGAVFHRVEMDGCVPLAEAGHPQVPVRGMLVGIPFGVEPGIRVIDVEVGGEVPGLWILPAPGQEILRGEIDRLLPVFEPDDSIYGGGESYPGVWAGKGWDGTLRFQRVLQVAVYPFQWSPGGRGQWARRVTFEVFWEEGADLKGLQAPPCEPAWEDVYRRAVVNDETAGSWRRSPLAPAGHKDAPDRQDEFKLIVAETGLHEIQYEDLGGLTAPFPLEELAVYQKVYSESSGTPWEETPIRIHLVDEDEDGNFGPGDRFYFWGLGFRDAYVVHGYEDRYTTDNIYWFGRGAAGGARMDTTATWTGAVAGTLTTFPEVLHFEEDREYENEPIGPDYDGVPPERDAEQWFWTWWNLHDAQVEIAIYGQDPISVPRVRARFTGGASGTHFVTPKIFSGVGGVEELDEFSFFDFSEYVFDSGDLLPADAMTEGRNHFSYEGYRVTSSGTSQRTGVYLDWVEVSYDRRLEAGDDYLVFNSGEHCGAVALAIENFTDDAILLFDVSTPGEEKWVVLPPGAVEETGGDYRLAFADSVGPDSVGAAGHWVALAGDAAKRLPADQIQMDESSTLHDSEGDYIIITHPLFADGIQALADYRQSQGYQVQVASIMDVYDEFSGGMKDPVAIKRYLKWGFDHWTVKPQFALLVGDGSEDHRGILATSGPDYVPSISSIAHDELAAVDNWFVRFDDESLLLDIFLGRLPVGSEADLDAVLSKILSYEEFSPEDTWRGRVCLLGDDQCSGVSYRCLRTSELQFETASGDAAELARNSPGSPMDAIEILLSSYTGYTFDDGYHASCFDSSISVPQNCIRDSVFSKVTPLLFDALNDGVLLFTFQGHGNRSTVFDEFVILDRKRFLGATVREDLRDFSANQGKPYVVHGFGCHFADFDQYDEEDPNTQESLLEKMLFLDGRGAVAALGSTALEAANTNAQYERELYGAFFGTLPTYADAGGAAHARWLLGEVQAVAIARLAAIYTYGTEFLDRYVLLGDPALRMDALPPTMSVTVDGIPAENGGVISAGDSSVVAIRVRVGDEVAIDSTSILVRIRRGDDLATLVAGQDYQVDRDTTVTGGRVLYITYPHEIEFAEYDILFDAADRNDRPVSFVLKVGFAFQAWSDGQLIVNGSAVPPGADLETEVLFPLAVAEGDLTVKLAGPRGTEIIAADTEILNDNGTRWRIAFSVSGLDPGLYHLVFQIGSLEKEMISFFLDDRLRIQSVVAYPSPFQEGTDFTFVLTRTADVRIRIFTVAGHRIRTLYHPGAVDFNSVPWDGHDEDGDDIANGVYLYRITATSGDEEAESGIEKAVRMK
ncbi:MAG: hypothetical protein KAW17_02650 [Candidatus Eisenbacteria sp.]|nr:hypothetical protein [Candidatus Eisenbacteria bacterium]